MEKYIFKKLLFFFAVISTSVCGAKNIYVATTGNDSPNDGTAGKPYLTINKAAQVAVAGDVVIIKSGTYFPSTLISVANSGTAVAPIIFRAEVKDGVIIDGSSSSTPSATDRLGLFSIIGTSTVYKSWITIDGLRVINSAFSGIHSRYTDNITIKNCSTNNTGASGIIGANSSNMKVLNNKVQQACMYPNKTTNTNECITMASVNVFEVAYNIVTDRPTDPSNGGEGIDAKNACIKGTIHHNTVSNLWRVGIYIDAFSGNLNDVEVYANKVSESIGGGITIASEAGGIVNGVKVHDNVIYNIQKFGIRIAGYLNNGPLTNLDIYQNTVVGCGFNAGNWENCGILIEATNVSNTGFNIRNNIISGCPVQIRGNNQSFPIVIDKNILFGSTLLSGTNVITSNPLFVNPSANDFQLNSGSPAINAAVGSPLSVKDFRDLARPVGTSSDIGAFEYNGNLATTRFMSTEQNAIRVYPNPSKDLMTIDTAFAGADKYTLSLYDMHGKLIYSSDLLDSSTRSYTINISKFNSGLYILKISAGSSEISSTKVVIEK